MERIQLNVTLSYISTSLQPVLTEIWKETIMKKLTFAVAALLLSAAGARADSIGIAACDDFIVKYDACISGKVPAAHQAAFKSQIEQLKKTWTELAKDSNTKPALEATCKQSAEQMKAGLQSYGCSF